LIKAVGIWDFLIDSVFARFDKKSGEGKAKISREVVPILNLISDKIVQAYYVGEVAKRLEVSEEAVEEQVERKQEGQKVEEGPAFTEAPEGKGRRELLEERLLSLGFRYDEALLQDKKLADLIKTPLALRIWEEYLAFRLKHKKFEISRFAKVVPEELFEGFAEMVLTEDFELDNPAEAPKEAGIVRRELEILAIKEKLIELEKEIKKSGKGADKFNQLTEALHNLEETGSQGIILEEER